MSTEAEQTLKNSLRRAAMDLLARREHSRAELVQKLSRKYPEYPDHIPPVLDQLEQDALLSDERFAQTYTRYRRNRGFGPLLIRQELSAKGLSSALISSATDSADTAWTHTLQELVARKTRGDSVAKMDVKARQKLFRFCLSRGFSADAISRVLRGDLEL